MIASLLHHIPHLLHLGVYTFLFLCAVLNGLIALALYARARSKYRGYLKADGVVSEIAKEKRDDGEMLFPVIRFRSPAKEYEVKSGLGRSSWNIKPGAAVPVIYNPANPLEAEIENRFIQYLLPLFFAAGSVLSLIVIPIAHFALKSFSHRI